MKKQEIYQKLSGYYDNYQITELLLKETGFSKNQLFLCDEIENIHQESINKYIQLNRSGYPFEYIIQKAEFYGLKFYVDERTLIPRNDTEVMVEKVLELLSGIIPPPSGTPFEKGKNKGVTLIDIGTGSSCIPISILKNTDSISKTYVVDISQEALEVSKININKHNLEKNITQLYGNLLTPIIPLLTKEGLGVVITANLPYILDNDFDNIDKETVKYEPDTALYGGLVTGFELYEELISQCLKLKKSGNINNIDLFIEIGFDQKQYSINYLNNLGLKNMYYKDNGGIERCVHIII